MSLPVPLTLPLPMPTKPNDGPYANANAAPFLSIDVSTFWMSHGMPTDKWNHHDPTNSNLFQPMSTTLLSFLLLGRRSTTTDVSTTLPTTSLSKWLPIHYVCSTSNVSKTMSN